MRIVFAGTPLFAARALAALIAAGHSLPLVLTQPDRPAGRGMKRVPSPVKQLAAEHGLEMYQPPTLREQAALERLRACAPEALVVAAYGLMLPQAVLDVAPLGALNIHASLLPRWRGAAPIQRAILAGDRETGITIMQMDAGLDTGAMLARRSIPIVPGDTAGTLHDALALLGAELLLQALEELQRGVARATPQAADGASYARKIEKSEARLDWRKPAAELDREVRAFNPLPGAQAQLAGGRVKIWRAAPAEGSGVPGAVLECGEAGIRVACGRGALVLTELQLAGAIRMNAREFLRGHPLAPGACFGVSVD